MWLKIKQEGLRRFWSRVPFGTGCFEPQPFVEFAGVRQANRYVLPCSVANAMPGEGAGGQRRSGTAVLGGSLGQRSRWDGSLVCFPQAVLFGCKG